MKKIRIPPMLSDLMLTTLSACEGVVFVTCRHCRDCGGELSGYDFKKKRFATILDGNRKRTIHVIVKRYICRSCHTICHADEPFYPGTRIGSPVIDLCKTLATMMPYARVSTTLAQMDIIVDRWSVRNYARNGYPPPQTVEMFGIRLPMSLVTLSTVVAGVREGQRIDPVDFIAACGLPPRRM